MGNPARQYYKPYLQKEITMSEPEVIRVEYWLDSKGHLRETVYIEYVREYFLDLPITPVQPKT